jgi:hypothetical protein
MTKQPNDSDDAKGTEFYNGVLSYLREKGSTVLRGQYFDVGDEEGRQKYAEWLTNEVVAIVDHMNERDGT